MCGKFRAWPNEEASKQTLTSDRLACLKLLRTLGLFKQLASLATLATLGESRDVGAATATTRT